MTDSKTRRAGIKVSKLSEKTRRQRTLNEYIEKNRIK